MTKDELQTILADHKTWLDSDGKNGKLTNLTGADLRGADLFRAYLPGADLFGAILRGAYLPGANLTGADLRGADLTGANLCYADLRGAILRGANLFGVNLFNTVGNLAEVKSLHIDTYIVTYTADRLQIGCKNHSFGEWCGFGDDAISEMDSRALEWWKKHKDIIFQIIELSPATPTGHEGSTQ